MTIIHHMARRIILRLLPVLILSALIPSLSFGAGFVEVKGIRYSSSADYTRVVIDLSTGTSYRNDRIQKPDRLYIDLAGSVLPKEMWKTLNLGDGPLKAVRMAQFDPGTVRVVFDLNEIKNYRIFTLSSPPRIVVDVFGPGDVTVARNDSAEKGVEKGVEIVQAADAESPVVEQSAAQPVQEVAEQSQSAVSQEEPVKKMASAENVAEASAVQKDTADNAEFSAKSLAKQKWLPGKKTLDAPGNIRTVRRVVIDAGHGGHDPGASGSNGIVEKNVVLDVAKRIKKILESKGNYEVYLTRDKDKFLSLEERTVVANEKNADLFISVHANAHNNRSISGLETYFLNFTNDAEALKVAARENKISMKRVHRTRSESEVILASLELQNNRDESLRLANYVHGSMVSEVDRNYGHVKDLGVKEALFYVLFGAKMPSVLVEVSFITNPEEARRLKSPTYRQHLASGIAGGVDKYFDTLPPEQKVALRY